MNSQRIWIIISSVMGFLGVALGAFGAHSLKSSLDPGMLEVFKTGVQYQLIHSVAMLTIALSGNLKFIAAEIFFLTGIILFSFSLYIYSITSVTAFAMITPLGGISFLTGWIVLIIVAIKKQ